MTTPDTLDACVEAVVHARYRAGVSSFAAQVTADVLAQYPGPWSREPEQDVIRAIVRAKLRRVIVFSAVAGWIPRGRHKVRRGYVRMTVSGDFYDKITLRAREAGTHVSTVFARAVEAVIRDHEEKARSQALALRPRLTLPAHTYRAVGVEDGSGVLHVFGHLGVVLSHWGKVVAVETAFHYDYD